MPEDSVFSPVTPEPIKGSSVTLATTAAEIAGVNVDQGSSAPLPVTPDVRVGAQDPRFANQLSKVRITTPDIDAKLTVGFPGVYDNSRINRQVEQTSSFDYLAPAMSALGNTTNFIRNEAARQTEELKSQNELLRQQIATKRSQSNGGFAGFLFGDGKYSGNNREVNPLAGKFGERGGGALGALGWILGSIGATSNAVNSELFTIEGQDTSRTFDIANSATRSVLYGNGTDVVESPRTKAYNEYRGFIKIQDAARYEGKAYPTGMDKAFVDTQVKVWRREYQKYDNPFSGNFYQNVGADINNIGRYARNVKRKFEAVGTIGRPGTVDPLGAVIATLLPTNWAVGLNPFVNKPALNRATADKGVAQNVSDIFTQGRQYDDINNPYTKDGLFYDAKRLDASGKDTYNDLQKIGSTLFGSIANPGEALSDAILIDKFARPLIGKTFRKVVSFIPGKKEKLTKAVISTPLEVKAPTPTSVVSSDTAFKQYQATPIPQQGNVSYSAQQQLQNIGADPNTAAVTFEERLASIKASQAAREAELNKAALEAVLPMPKPNKKPPKYGKDPTVTAAYDEREAEKLALYKTRVEKKLTPKVRLKIQTEARATAQAEAAAQIKKAADAQARLSLANKSKQLALPPVSSQAALPTLISKADIQRLQALDLPKLPPYDPEIAAGIKQRPRAVDFAGVKQPEIVQAELLSDGIGVTRGRDSSIIDVYEQRALPGASVLPEQNYKLPKLEPKPPKVDADGFIVEELPQTLAREKLPLGVKFGDNGALATRPAGQRGVFTRVEGKLVDGANRPFIDAAELFAGEKSVNIPAFRRVLAGAPTSVGDYKEVVTALVADMPAFSRDLYKIQQATTKADVFALVKKYTGLDNLMSLLAKTSTATELAKPVASVRNGVVSVVRRFPGGASVPKLTAVNQLPISAFDALTIDSKTLSRAVLSGADTKLSDIIATQRVTQDSIREFKSVVETAAEYLGVDPTEVKSYFVNDTVKSLVISDISKISGLPEAEVRKQLSDKLPKAPKPAGKRMPKSNGDKRSASVFVRPYTTLDTDTAGMNAITFLRSAMAIMVDDVDVARVVGSTNYESQIKSKAAALLDLSTEEVDAAIKSPKRSAKVEQAVTDIVNSKVATAGVVESTLFDNKVVNLDLSRTDLGDVPKVTSELPYVGTVKPEPSPFTYVIEEATPSTVVDTATGFISPKLNEVTNKVLSTLNDLGTPDNYTHASLDVTDLPAIKLAPDEDVVTQLINDDINTGVFTDIKQADEAEASIREQLANPQVNLVSVFNDTERLSTSLIDEAVDNVTVNVSIAELSKLEQKSMSVANALNLPEQYNIIPRSESFDVVLKGRDDVVVNITETELKAVVNGIPVTDTVSPQNIEKLAALQLDANDVPVGLPKPFEAIDDVVSDSINQLEIEIPTIVKLQRPSSAGVAVNIPGTKKKIDPLVHASALRSDGLLVVPITEMLDYVGKVPLAAKELGFPTKLGTLTSAEISVLPKQVLADVLTDLQEIQLQIIAGLDDLNNKKYPAVGIPKQPGTDYIEDITNLVMGEPKAPAPLSRLTATPEDVIVVDLPEGREIGYHGTAVRNWQPTRNVFSESVNSLGFGTYVSSNADYAASAGNRFYGNDFSGTLVDVGSPSVHTLSTNAPMKIIDAESKILPTSIKKFMQQYITANEIDVASLFKATKSFTVREAYNKIINFATVNGNLDEYTARSLLHLMDTYLVKQGFQGIVDTANESLKVISTDLISSKAISQVPFNPLDKHRLLEQSFNSLKTASRGMFDNTLDFSRAIDDKFEVLKQANSILDDQIEKAFKVRNAIADSTDLTDDVFYGARAGEDSDSILMKDTQYQDDLKEVGGMIDPEDLCDY